MEKIGGKIKQMRVQKNLTQEELADRCELSKGFISQVERDLTSPSIATLVDILECLGSNLREFFAGGQDEKVVFRVSDVFEKENPEMGQKIKWLIPNAQKNTMEPIHLTLIAGGRTDIELPHEGEEFGYVMGGTVFLHRGQNKYKVQKGESFYFIPDTEHYISNAGKYTAIVLWVASPPSF
jgi:transcriptional regulator with XRE-family HTH domain